MFSHFLFVVKPLKITQQARLCLLRLLSVSLLGFSFVASISHTNAASPSILVYGDSLSAAYGLKKSQGWVALLQNKLAADRYQYSVINASISGETTSGGLSRLTNTLAKTKPHIIIVALGANDGLRGLPIKEMTANLNAIITQSKKMNAKVLLIGMKIPPNYGAQYTNAFSQAYQQLSQQHQVSLVPFMLNNIAAKPALIQEDGLHPNALSQPILLDNIWPTLQPLLNR